MRRLGAAVLSICLASGAAMQVRAGEAAPDDIRAMALNMYHEARGEGRLGMLAVGWVVLNRMADKAYPKTVSAVVYQGCQFSWVCDRRSDWPAGRTLLAARSAGGRRTSSPSDGRPDQRCDLVPRQLGPRSRLRAARRQGRAHRPAHLLQPHRAGRAGTGAAPAARQPLSRQRYSPIRQEPGIPSYGIATTCQSRSTRADPAESGTVRMVSQTAQAKRSAFRAPASS